jgi:GNAT superfamily N-acetyltransferase
MKNEIIIRKTTKKDIENLQRLYGDFFKQMNKFAKFVRIDETKNSISKSSLQILTIQRDALFLVAEKEDSIIGFVFAKISNNKKSRAKNNKVVEVLEIYARKKRRGIGAMLFEEIEKWAKKEKADWIKWEFLADNRCAERFCIKKGFRLFQLNMLKKVK